MANKQKKKRNKVYTGVDSSVVRPVITRVSAVNRSKVGQWWFDHKRIARPVLIGVAVAAAIIIMIIEIAHIASGA